MKANKKRKLEKSGWAVGNPKEFLGLSDVESEFVELKLSLATAFTKKRKELQLTQLKAAKRIGSSQSRVAKLEAGDASVSLDLLIRGLLKLGLSRKELAKVIRVSKAS